MKLIDTLNENAQLNAQSWAKFVRTIAPKIIADKVYTYKTLATMVNTEWSDPNFIPAITFIGSASGAVLNTELCINHKGQKYILTPEQANAALSGQKIYIGEYQYDNTKVTIQFRATKEQP